MFLKVKVKIDLGNVWMLKKKSHLAFLYEDEGFVRTYSFFFMPLSVRVAFSFLHSFFLLTEKLRIFADN